jgi:hypothetical protein
MTLTVSGTHDHEHHTTCQNAITPKEFFVKDGNYQAELLTPVKLTSYAVTVTGPPTAIATESVSVALYGSVDGHTWDTIHSSASNVFVYDVERHFSIRRPEKAYLYYEIAIAAEADENRTNKEGDVVVSDAFRLKNAKLCTTDRRAAMAMAISRNAAKTYTTNPSHRTREAMEEEDFTFPTPLSMQIEPFPPKTGSPFDQQQQVQPPVSSPTKQAPTIMNPKKDVIQSREAMITTEDLNFPQPLSMPYEPFPPKLVLSFHQPQPPAPKAPSFMEPMNSASSSAVSVRIVRTVVWNRRQII